MAKKRTELQEEYRKQLRNLNKRLKNLENKGFIINREDIVPEKPKRLSRPFIEKIKNIKAKTLYPTIEYKDPLTGKIYKGKEAKELSKQRQKLLKEQKKFLQQGDDIPTITNIDYVKDMINLQFDDYNAENIPEVDTHLHEIPDERSVRADYSREMLFVNTGAMREFLLNLLYDGIHNMGEEAYDEHLGKYLSVLQDAIEGIKQASKQGILNTCFMKAGTILKGSILNQDESRQAQDFTEALTDYEDFY